MPFSGDERFVTGNRTPAVLPQVCFQFAVRLDGERGRLAPGRGDIPASAAMVSDTAPLPPPPPSAMATLTPLQRPAPAARSTAWNWPPANATSWSVFSVTARNIFPHAASSQVQLPLDCREAPQAHERPAGQEAQREDARPGESADQVAIREGLMTLAASIGKDALTRDGARVGGRGAGGLPHPRPQLQAPAVRELHLGAEVRDLLPPGQ